VIKPQFEDIYIFLRGFVSVKQNGKWGFIDFSSYVIVEPPFDEIRYFPEDFFVGVKQNGKWGFIDNTGKLVVKPQFDEIRGFSGHLAGVKQNGKWGFVIIEVVE
jgi:hypothetical protein